MDSVSSSSSSSSLPHRARTINTKRRKCRSPLNSEQQQQRRERNRRMAAESRQRAKRHLEDLEAHVDRLTKALACSEERADQLRQVLDAIETPTLSLHTSVSGGGDSSEREQTPSPEPFEWFPSPCASPDDSPGNLAWAETMRAERAAALGHV